MNKAVRIGVSVVGGGILLIALFVAGLFIYVNATAKPLHPDPGAVPSVARPSQAPNWTAPTEKARQVVRTALTTQNLPGVSVAVGAGGEIVWAEGFGFADIEKRTTVTPETPFRIGDVSVTLTSAAAGLLVDRDRLNLDTTVQRYVPDFPEKQWPVTLRHLMGNVSGVRQDAGDEESMAPCTRTVEGLQRFAQDPLRFEPGTRFRASSYGWILVSAAIESAAGEPFFTFMKTQVFEPLGMTATRVFSYGEPIPNLPTFYFPRFGGDTRLGPELAREGDHTCFAGASAFLSTASDLVRFGLALQGGKLLKPATLEMLQTPQQLPSGEMTTYGLGWEVETADLAGTPAKMAGHGTKQDFIGGTTYLMTFPERGLVVAVTSNTSFGDAKTIALGVAHAFAEGAAAAGK